MMEEYLINEGVMFRDRVLVLCVEAVEDMEEIFRLHPKHDSLRNPS